MGHGMVHRRMVHGGVMDPMLGLHACTWTEHGSGHRAPHREQDDQQQHEPDANGFHDGQGSTPSAARRACSLP